MSILGPMEAGPPSPKETKAVPPDSFQMKSYYSNQQQITTQSCLPMPSSSFLETSSKGVKSERRCSRDLKVSSLFSLDWTLPWSFRDFYFSSKSLVLYSIYCNTCISSFLLTMCSLHCLLHLIKTRFPWCDKNTQQNKTFPTE